MRIPRIFIPVILLLLMAGRGWGQIVYENDFETSAGAEWSNSTIDVTPLGARSFLGQFGSGTVNLSLTSLPTHDHVTVSFDLFVIRSWGATQSLSAPMSGG